MAKGNTKLGRILWWDIKDQNGVLVDSSGIEFYFDVSVISTVRNLLNLKSGTVVQFRINSAIASPRCAMSVQIPPANLKSKFEKEFNHILQLAFEIDGGV